MFEKYITIKESKIVAKQTSSGVWYCSDLPVDTVYELDKMIGEVNKVLNKYNNGKEKKKEKPSDKENKNVKGLQ